MTAKIAVFAFAVVLSAMASGACAEELPGRYTITPMGDGFLRLDTTTGAVSVCSRTSTGFACEGAADDVAALKQEVDRLSRKVEALNDKLAKAEASGEPGAPDSTPPPAGPNLQLPRHALDEMTALFDEMIRRLQDMVRDLKQPEPEKSL
jgi:uncharacterized coiled-coil protein SlyX